VRRRETAPLLTPRAHRGSISAEVPTVSFLAGGTVVKRNSSQAFWSKFQLSPHCCNFRQGCKFLTGSNPYTSANLSNDCSTFWRALRGCRFG
jgi:hypothetical protein